MNKKQEPKYDVENGSIVNRGTGIAIPEDEPVFILRAKDKHARSAIEAYLDKCVSPTHVVIVSERLDDFNRFAENNPVNEPDSNDSVGQR